MLTYDAIFKTNKYVVDTRTDNGGEFKTRDEALSVCEQANRELAAELADDDEEDYPSRP